MGVERGDLGSEVWVLSSSIGPDEGRGEVGAGRGGVGALA